jgi:hypothetical protein
VNEQNGACEVMDWSTKVFVDHFSTVYTHLIALLVRRRPELSSSSDDVGWGDVDWIGVAQDRGRCRALVNSVMNLRFVGWKTRGKEATRKSKA